MQNGKTKIEQKVLGYVGLAARAGTLLKGADSVLDGIVRGRVKLVLIARDAGSIADVVTRNCHEESIPVLTVVDKADLGWQLGRQAYAVVGITSADLAHGIIQAVESLSTTDQSGGVL